ncbi:MAG: thiamine-phosphate kinase [Nitrospirae bacterium]|nr:thiamine-phosphate kinase [Nitrospirota bacterium]
MELSRLGEFGLIEKIRSSFSGASSEIIKGIGDDAAALKTSRSKITLVTTDMLLEGVHFNLSFTTFYQLGYKSLAVNISDIFAMGGRPKYFLIGLGIPKGCDSKNIDDFYSGINSLAEKWKINIIGGDTCASRNGFIISGTLIGEAEKIITRSGAKPGDWVFATNTLGDSAMGLRLLEKTGNKKSKAKSSHFPFPISYLKLINKHLMPDIAPLKNISGINSMIDISDGLLIDLSHICDESKVGARIYEDKVPLSQELKEAAKNLRLNPLSFALQGGEDYALLFTAPKGFKTNAFRIGEIIPKGSFIVDTNGKEKPFKAAGYEHFKSKF